MFTMFAHKIAEDADKTPDTLKVNVKEGLLRHVSFNSNYGTFVDTFTLKNPIFGPDFCGQRKTLMFDNEGESQSLAKRFK